ncbi:MAG: helix-turn-helix transcriptional regulator [Fimbriimonadales bacterium]|nr:helix-turn-helix transcriptional regulator [Fimbriimonadales bacterium]
MYSDSGGIESMVFRNGLEALLLAALREGPLHGYAIAQRLRRESGEVLRFGESQIYPALHALERQGLVSTSWEPQDGRPPRRVYAITPQGSARLEQQTREWHRFSRAVSSLLGSSETSDRTRKEALGHA